MKTIRDIVAEMRKDMPRVVDTKVILRNYADRIEQSVTKCNQLKMREALKELIVNIEMRSPSFGLNVMVDTKTFLDAKAALSAPPRNCDLYETEYEALKAFHATHPISTYYLYVKWLFAEAKGGNKNA